MPSARRPLLMLSLAIAIAFSCAAFNLLVDPYGAWGTGIVAPAFGKVNDERLQIPYLLRTSAPETILVGNSRVAWGIPIEEGYRDGVLNAGILGATVPEAVRIIDVALAEKQLKRIVWFVDFLAFSDHYNKVDTRFDARLSGNLEAKVEETLFSLTALGDSFDTLKRTLGGRARLRRTRTVSIPWPMDFICTSLNTRASSDLSTVPDFVLATQLTRNWYTDYRFSPALLRLFSATVQKARSQGVEVVLVMAPMSQYELEFLRQSGQWQKFQEFKRMIAGNGPVWDFTGYNAIARTDHMFRDATHMEPAVGQMVLRIVLGKDSAPCNAATAAIETSGVLIQPGSLESVLAEQDQMRIAADDPSSRYSKMATRIRNSIAAKNAASTSESNQSND
jgi:hypothetical protein